MRSNRAIVASFARGIPTPHFRRSAAVAAVLTFGMASLAASSPALAWEMRVCADFNQLPFSNRDETGFENRIARILAEELNADLVFEWWPQRDVIVANALRPGLCDIMIGVGDGGGTTLTTFSYYRSPFVFVYRANQGYDVFTFDDPILRELQLGVQPMLGPTHEALLTRGLRENLEVFEFLGGETNDPLAPAIEAVANGEVDVAVVWGPAAGYYAQQQEVELVVQPVPPFEPPFTPMYINMSIGVRLGDESLRDRLDIALANRWDEINAILADYHIPTMPLTRPTLTIEVP